MSSTLATWLFSALISSRGVVEKKLMYPVLVMYFCAFTETDTNRIAEIKTNSLIGNSCLVLNKQRGGMVQLAESS
jgi:hypothetical protein